MPRKFVIINDFYKNQIIEDYKNRLLIKDIIRKLPFSISPSHLITKLKEWNVDLQGYTRHRKFDYNIIIPLYSELKSTIKVAKKLNISSESVRDFLHQNGIEVKYEKHVRFNKLLESLKDKIIEDYNNGLSGWDIGKKYNIKGHNIYNYLTKWGIKVESKKSIKLREFWDKNKIDIISLYFDEFYTLDDIGKIYGKCAATIGDLFKKDQILVRPNFIDRRSSLERKFDKILEYLGIEFETQFQINDRYYDYFLRKYKILLEVNGDYWHGNPKFYKKENLNDIQKDAQKRDIIKTELAKKFDYKIIFIWEDDIKNNLELVKKQLLELINNAN